MRSISFIVITRICFPAQPTEIDHFGFICIAIACCPFLYSAWVYHCRLRKVERVAYFKENATKL